MSVFMPLVARPAAVRALRDCYEILGDLTPLKSNCGKLCGRCLLRKRRNRRKRHAAVSL